MFGRKKSRQAAIKTLISADTRVRGDLEFSGGCLIDGYVEGNVTSTDEGATLSISERGCIEGAVVVPHILLNGTIRGDVHAIERVELGSKARVNGNVRYKLVEMAVGAEVNGKLIHERDGPEAEQALPETGAPAETGTADGALRAANAVGE